MIFLAVAIGLGTAALVEWLKHLIPWPLHPGTKGFLAIAIATALSVALSPGTWKTVVETDLAAVGTAPLFHALDAVLRLKRDELKVEVMVGSSALQRRVRSGGTPGPQTIPGRNSTARIARPT